VDGTVPSSKNLVDGTVASSKNLVDGTSKKVGTVEEVAVGGLEGAVGGLVREGGSFP
jgi:hypothetical protein